MNLKILRGPHRWWVGGKARIDRPVDAGRHQPAPAPPPPPVPTDWKVENERQIERLRQRGVKIGEGCVIFTTEFSLEPYLVEIGNRVGISGGTQFLTHDGAVWLLRPRRPLAQHFGRIIVGDNTYIGQNCLILPGTRIGASCVIGAGSVVRATIPDNSVVAGNPAKVIGRTSLFIEMMEASPDTFDSLDLSSEDRESLVLLHFGLPERSAIAARESGVIR